MGQEAGRKGIRRGWLALALGSQATLLILTHIPQSRVPVDLNWLSLDKVVHILAYGVVTGLFLLALGVPVMTSRLLAIAVSMLVVAALDEWTQGWVGRSPSRADFLADALGVMIATCAFRWQKGRWKVFSLSVGR